MNRLSEKTVKDIERCAQWKERSQKTHSVHERELQENHDYTSLLLGDSMLERFKDSHCHMHRLSRCFNAGVGGDKISNVLYRIQCGLFDLLPANLNHTLIHVGTNNLKKKNTPDQVFREYELLVRAIHESFPQATVTATGLFYREDVPDGVVDHYNLEVKRIIEGGRDRFLAAPKITKMQRCDDVHLNGEGYAQWDDYLMEHWGRSVATNLLGKNEIASTKFLLTTQSPANWLSHEEQSRWINALRSSRLRTEWNQTAEEAKRNGLRRGYLSQSCCSHNVSAVFFRQVLVTYNPKSDGKQIVHLPRKQKETERMSKEPFLASEVQGQRLQRSNARRNLPQQNNINHHERRISKTMHDDKWLSQEEQIR
ncbi:hypothetical protein PROFUN_08803 [Planoprotostelium fungivorum]|uniref:SGNH hydrolase-type esterase domain-containing protein n=1 Tax=Planoprotostelium fungivorum TaxID=1890364 RepID=A0A2P6MVT2_9EUKA|nr:hypothetical protein PROFUN_08803 [Planoprotostelium fungivorum]